MDAMNRLERICWKSAAWHETRRKSIGSSEAKIIMDGAPESLIRLWQEKRGEIEPEDLSRVVPVCIGTVTEPLNLAFFEDETGLTVTREGEQVTHPEFAFMGATLDGWIAPESAVVECKHVGGFEPFETVVARYMPQVHHTMSVTDARKAYLSVLIGTGQFRIQPIEPDPFYLAELIEREAAFWKCVERGEPPAPMPPVPTPIPPEKMRVADMSGSNSWANHAAIWKETRPHAKRFEAAVKELKGLIEPDVRLATGHGISAKRDKRGVTIGEMQ